MRVLKAGTRVKTVIGDIEAFITGINITMNEVEYRISYFHLGDRKHEWVYRYEIQVCQPKQAAGFHSHKLTPSVDNEVTLIVSNK